MNGVDGTVIKIKLFGAHRSPCITNNGMISWRELLENNVNSWLEQNKGICVFDTQYKIHDECAEIMIQYAEDEQ